LTEITKLKEKIKKLEKDLNYYKRLQARAFTDFKNKQILEKRFKSQVEIERDAEKKTRSFAQQMRREEERKTKALLQQEEIRKNQLDCVAKMADKWQEAFDESK